MISRFTAMISRCTAAALLLSALLTPPQAAEAETLLKGAGANFPFPIYIRWFRDFSQKYRDIQIQYRNTGSGAGIQDFLHGTVDFAASSTPLTAEEIAKVKRGVVLLPMAAEQVAVIYNLEGIDQLRLPRDVYPDIFLGKISNWNHPKIAEANPDIELPDMPITVVTRSDASGITDIFTRHLCAVNADFREQIGRSRQPNWPDAGSFIQFPGNQGVAARVKQTPGAIGYVDYSFTKLLQLPVAQLQNKRGTFVSPGPQSSAAALTEIAFPENNLPVSNAPNLAAHIPDPNGKTAYPIVGLNWLLLNARQDETKAEALRKLALYILSEEAQRQASQFGYIPLPQAIREQVKRSVEFIH